MFADLARKLPTFTYDREKGRFRSYLAGLVNWRVMDRLRLSKRDADLKMDFKQNMKVVGQGDDDFAMREWQAAAMEEALRRIKGDVRPDWPAAESVADNISARRPNFIAISQRMKSTVKPH